MTEILGSHPGALSPDLSGQSFHNRYKDGNKNMSTAGMLAHIYLYEKTVSLPLQAFPLFPSIPRNMTCLWLKIGILPILENQGFPEKFSDSENSRSLCFKGIFKSDFFPHLHLKYMSFVLQIRFFKI